MKYLALVLALFAVTATAQTPRQAVITFSAPTARTDGSAITGALSYQIFQGVKGSAKVKVGTITTTSATLTTGLEGGKEYCWDVVAIEAGNAAPSDHSAEACKAFSLSAPNAVTITVN